MNAAGKAELSTFFSASEVLCRVKSRDRNTVIRELLEMLALQRGIGNVDVAVEAVLEREAAASTVLVPGLAVPHARLEAIDSLVVAVATSEEGILYPEEGIEPVHLIILILAPNDAPGLYLQALSSLAGICQDPETPTLLAAMSDSTQIWNFFQRGGMILPDYVCARDIMQSDPIVLEEHDPLKKAIDTFIREHLIEIPVVDSDGDLMGVVSAHELLKVCLPDYILWMEDLSPILNFEPFAEILRNESSTWLAEIMNFEYATVLEDAPAVQVAKEITRRKTHQAYVLREKKLVGMITLDSFLDKVLRE